MCQSREAYSSDRIGYAERRVNRSFYGQLQAINQPPIDQLSSNCQFQALAIPPLLCHSCHPIATTHRPRNTIG